MNIFYLDECIKTNASYHVDKHVVKMRVELAQLASTAHWLSGGYAPYKPTHHNHPCAVWVRNNLQNYDYCVNLGLALCDEKDYRYGLKYQSCREVLLHLKEFRPNIQQGQMTPLPLAMPDECKIEECAVCSYRNYYNMAKRGLFSWKKRCAPFWILS